MTETKLYPAAIPSTAALDEAATRDVTTPGGNPEPAPRVIFDRGDKVEVWDTRRKAWLPCRIRDRNVAGKGPEGEIQYSYDVRGRLDGGAGFTGRWHEAMVREAPRAARV